MRTGGEQVLKPCPLDGTEGLTPHNAARLSVLMIRHYFGFRFGYRRDSAMIWFTVTFAAVTALIVAWPLGCPAVAWITIGAMLATVAMFGALIVVGLLVSLWWGRRRGVVLGYFDATATQIVRCRGSRWVLGDHFAMHPGRGEAAPFRRRIFTHIAAEADRQGVTVAMSTRVPALRDRYVVDMPGLRIVSVQHGLWQLKRDPHSG